MIFSIYTSYVLEETTKTMILTPTTMSSRYLRTVDFKWPLYAFAFVIGEFGNVLQLTLKYTKLTRK
jgi:hypothetical protein